MVTISLTCRHQSTRSRSWDQYTWIWARPNWAGQPGEKMDKIQVDYYKRYKIFNPLMRKLNGKCSQV